MLGFCNRSLTRRRLNRISEGGLSAGAGSGDGAAKGLLHHGGDCPVNPLLVRPAMATDEYLIDVRADEQQQQIRGALEAEPRTKLRLRYQELQHRSVALCTPALVEDNDLGHVRIAVCRHARNEPQRRYPPRDFARTCHPVARRLIKVWLCCQPAKPGLLVRGERIILAHDREVVV